MPSIQPKQSAWSTDSDQVRLGRPVAFFLDQTKADEHSEALKDEAERNGDRIYSRVEDDRHWDFDFEVVEDVISG